jgi:8-oxo-dGTP diphosphatase
MNPFRCACLVDQRGDTLLLVRVRQNSHWYLPGGKIEEDESAESALARELAEELGIALIPESVQYLYTVVGPAYGQAGSVALVCYCARWRGEPRPLREISEVRWIDIRERAKLAPAVQILCAEHLAPKIGPARERTSAT